MEEIRLEKKNFDTALANIDQLSKENNEVTELKKVEEKKKFLVFKLDKGVKGQDLNAVINEVQGDFIKINDRINVLFKQLTEVYRAFESLDKEYIAGIVGSFEQAIEATKKSDNNQKDIARIINSLSTAVEKLKAFNEQVSAELSKLDADEWKNKLQNYSDEVQSITLNAEEIVSRVTSLEVSNTEIKHELGNYKKQLIVSWCIAGVSMVTAIVAIVLAIVL